MENQQTDSTSFQDRNAVSVTRFASDFLATLNSDESFLVCGSVAELPIPYICSNFTDVDVLYYDRKVIATQLAHYVQPRMKMVLQIETKHSHPGYARLRRDDGTLFRHKYKDFDLYPVFGPSKRREIETRVEEMLFRCNKAKTVITKDNVFAVQCPTRPQEASGFVTRHRTLTGWPSKVLIDEVVRGGCHLVAKAHGSHPDDDTEWRFSFSRAETTMFQSFTPNQLYVYHLLRLIKKDLLQRCETREESWNGISTYTFKTLMLWACEEKSDEFWRFERLSKSISELLLILVGWLIERRCPNYFIPENNMMDHVPYIISFDEEIEFLLERCNEQFLEAWLQARPKACLDCILEIDVPIRVYLGQQLTLINMHFCDDAIRLKLRETILRLIEIEIKDLVRALTLQKMLSHQKRGSANYKDPIFEHLVSEIEMCYHRCRNRPRSEYRTSTSSVASGQRAIMACIESYFDYEEEISGSEDSKNGMQSCEKLDLKSPGIHEGDSFYRQKANLRCSSCSENVYKKQTELVCSAYLWRKNAEMEIPSFLASLAYEANYNYMALSNFDEAIKLSDLVKESNVSEYNDYSLPVLLLTNISEIFDKCVQTILGFFALVKNELIHLKRPEQPRRDNNHSTLRVTVSVCPTLFIYYIAVQCQLAKGCLGMAIEAGEKLIAHQHNCGFHEKRPVFPFLVMAACLRMNGFEVFNKSSTSVLITSPSSCQAQQYTGSL